MLHTHAQIGALLKTSDRRWLRWRGEFVWLGDRHTHERTPPFHVESSTAGCECVFVCMCVCVCKPTPGINHIHLISLAPPSPPLLPFLPYLWFYSWSVARPNLEHSTSLSGPGERVRIDHMVTGQREEEEERPHGPAPLTSPFLQGHVAWTIQGGGNTVVYRTKLYPVCGISSRHVPSYLWVHGLATSTVRKIIARLDLPSFAQLYVIQP